MYSHVEGPSDLGLPFLGKSWIRSSNRACGETEQAEEVDQTSLADFSVKARRKARWLKIVFLLRPCGWEETTVARVKGGGCCLNHSSEPCGWASLLGWEFQWWPKTNQAALLKGGDRISNLDMSSLKTSALPCFHCISGWVHKVPCAGSPVEPHLGAGSVWSSAAGSQEAREDRLSTTQNSLVSWKCSCPCLVSWIFKVPSNPNPCVIPWSWADLIKLSGHESLREAVCRHLVSGLGKQQDNIHHLLAAKLS